jgi:hypothetical protein
LSTTSTIFSTSTSTLTHMTTFVAGTSTLTSTASTATTSAVTQCNNPQLYANVEPCGSGTFPTPSPYGSTAVTEQQCCFQCYSTQNCAYWLFLPSANGNECYLGDNPSQVPGSSGSPQCPLGVYGIELTSPAAQGQSGGSFGPCGSKCN